MSLCQIQKTNPDNKDGGYKRALHLAPRMWLPYHSALLACAFVEEKGEAMLSCLASVQSEDTTSQVLCSTTTQLSPSSLYHMSRSTWPEGGLQDMGT